MTKVLYRKKRDIAWDMPLSWFVLLLFFFDHIVKKRIDVVIRAKDQISAADDDRCDPQKYIECMNVLTPSHQYMRR